MSMNKIIIGIISILSMNVLASGEVLFNNNCVKCHGVEKIGSIGLPLTKEVVSNLSDDYIKMSILLGIPGRIMPKFNFSDNQLSQVVDYLRSGLPAPKYKEIIIPGIVGNGKKIYKSKCSTCHGKSLEGGVGTGRNFSWQKDRVVSPPSLGNPGFLKSASNEMIKHIIENGISGSEMIGYGVSGVLSDKDINDVVAYIRSYETETTPEEIDESIVLEFESPYSMEETVKRVEDSAVAYNFRKYPTRDIFEGLSGLSGQKRFKQIRFCNFGAMERFLKKEPRLGIMLPCSATVFEDENKKVKVLIENYKLTIRDFNNHQLTKESDKLIDTMKEMIEEALW